MEDGSTGTLRRLGRLESHPEVLYHRSRSGSGDGGTISRVNYSTVGVVEGGSGKYAAFVRKCLSRSAESWARSVNPGRHAFVVGVAMCNAYEKIREERRVEASKAKRNGVGEKERESKDKEGNDSL